MLDSFFAWQQVNDIGGTFPVPEMTIEKGLGIALSEGCDYKCEVTVREVADRVAVPFSPLAIPGPAQYFQKVPLHAYVKMHVLSEHMVHVRFEGETFAFQDHFIDRGVPGQYETPDGQIFPSDINSQEIKRAFHVFNIPRWDVRDEEKSACLLAMIHEHI